ncbi:MAG: hypothetical protein P1U39_02445 [Legionellaceae bacterium]|nr:hypothetical protein [Legionellaceae bacterium]
MKKSALEHEVEALRQEVKRLQAAKSQHEPLPDAKPHPTEKLALHLDQDAKKALTDFLEQAKKDYENLSPATALALFALGALFGRVLTRNKGER